MDQTLDDLCHKYQLYADFDLIPGKGKLIGLSGIFPYSPEWSEMRSCITPFTKHDWLDEPVTASRVLLASFSDLISYWTRKKGEKYFPFSSQRAIELKEVSAYSTRLKAFLAGTLEEFLIAAYPELYVNSYVRDNIRPCVQYRGGQRKDFWRYRPEPEVEGYPEVRLSTFGDEQDEGD